MRWRSVCWFGFACFAAAVPPVLAQTAGAAAHPCDTQTAATKSVCRAAYDAVTSVVPVAALAAGGGNPYLGSAAGGQGFGDIGITFRGNFVRFILPATTYAGVDDTVAAARQLPIVIPTIDLRFGLMKKALPMGAATVDFIGSMGGIPERATEYIKFSPDVRKLAGVVLGFGYGFRIGIAPTGPMPTVSLNIGRHDMPKFTVGDIVAGSNFAYTVSVSAINARLLLGKRMKGFEFTVGAGADLMKGNYSVLFKNMTTSKLAPRADSTVSTMRILTLTNGSFILGKAARLTFEGGFQIGKDEKLPTIFQANNTKSGRFFGGVGLGFKL